VLGQTLATVPAKRRTIGRFFETTLTVMNLLAAEWREATL